MTVSINGTSGIVFADSSAQNTAPKVGMVNRIINGAMVIDQRNAGASVTADNNVYAVDRFRTYMSQSSKGTIQQNAGAVTPPVGFTNYLGFTSTSSYSISSTDHFVITQYIEGFNTADLMWGTANAQTITLSFWVRSSLTGTFGGSIQNSAFNRSYPFSYTISSANTWEQKSVTVAGDTAGTWIGSTNGIGMRVGFGLGVGSTLSGTAGAWAGSNFDSATGATSVVGTSGATFYITGVMLEKGSTATNYDVRPYGTELALCKRYFQQFGGTVAYEYIGDCICASSTSAYAGISLVTTMRAAPSFSYTGAASDFTTDAGNSNTQCTALSLNGAAANKVRLTLTVASGLTTSSYRTFLTYAGQTGKVQFSA